MRSAFVAGRTTLFPSELLQDFLYSGQSETEKLLQITSNSFFMEALCIASPTLAAELREFASNPEGFSTKRRDAIGAGLLRYLVRATTRCTPFGLFAGVCPVPLGEATAVRLGESHEHDKTLRLGAKEVWKIVQLLERDEQLQNELTFFTNPSSFCYGERIRLPYQDTYGQKSEGKVASLRLTDVVERITRLAERPVSLGVLSGALQQNYPEVSREQITVFLQKLIEEQLLLCTLRPPLTAVDPLRYVHDIASAHVGEVKQLETLSALLELTNAYNLTAPGAGVHVISQILERLGFAGGESQTYVQVDTRAHLKGQFAQEDVTKVEQAVDVLRALFPPREVDSLEVFQQDFVERYSHREVPLLEVLDEAIGIGAPAGYLNPQGHRNLPHLKETSKVVFAVLQCAAEKGESEVDLKNLNLEAFVDDTGDLGGADCFVRATECGGDRWLVLEGLSGPAGGTLGRFTHIDSAFKTFWQEKVAEETQQEEALYCDLSYTECMGHVNNVAIHESVYPYQTAVATTPGVDFEHHVPLRDILVGVGDGGFYFRSRTLGTQLVFRAPHVLNRGLAPNAVRFLLDVCERRAGLPVAWDWGEARNALEAFPRVRYGDVILSSACWRVPPQILQSSEETWGEEFNAFRKRVGLPRFVFAGFADNRLLLDTENETCLRLLKTVLKKESPYLEEALTGYDAADTPGPSGNHFTQFVVSLAGKPEALPTPIATTSTSSPVAARTLLPFQGCAYFKLYGPVDLSDDVLRDIQNLLTLARVETPDAFTHWFFIRYKDPHPHLRVRVFGEGDAFIELTRKLLRELLTLRDRGYLRTLEMPSYDREIERYGGARGMLACEHVFEADAELIVRLQGEFADVNRSVPLVAATADLLLHSLGYDLPSRVRALEFACQGYKLEFAEAESGGSIETMLSDDARNWRKDVWRYLSVVHPADTGAQKANDLYAAARAYEEALKDPGRQLHEVMRRLDDAQKLTLLTSLVHMHANRANLDRFQEFRALHLALKTLQGFRHHLPKDIAAHPFTQVQRSLV